MFQTLLSWLTYLNKGEASLTYMDKGEGSLMYKGEASLRYKGEASLTYLDMGEEGEEDVDATEGGFSGATLCFMKMFFIGTRGFPTAIRLSCTNTEGVSYLSADFPLLSLSKNKMV